MSNFIPAHHFMPAEDKLTDKFWKDAIDYHWHNTNLKSLLADKDVDEILEYATGDIDLKPFMNMTKTLKKDIQERFPRGFKGADEVQLMQYIKYCPLPAKINSATAIVSKIEPEITCTALDALAEAKKTEDLMFIKNKPEVEADLQGLYDKLQLGKVDLGTTKNSSEPFGESPYGLDLNEPDEEDVFVNLLYKLGVEAALETILQIFYELKNLKQTRRLETRDQLYYGVSCNRTFTSSITGLPDFKYQYPGSVLTAYSDLQDYSDNNERFIVDNVTPIELFNLFGNEICNKETLYDIVNGSDKFGYCDCNNISPQKETNFNTFKMQLVYCEIKSVDGVGVVSNPKKSPYAYMKPLTYTKDDETCTSQIWAQNTYCAWWLKNTKHFFGMHKLGYATRSKGNESYQNFSSNINKSQEKSAVELSIPENKKAQVASIKLMYSLIMSLPPGTYIDINFLQQAAIDLKETFGDNVVEQLIDLKFERNIFLGSSAGFDDKPNMGNFKPFSQIPGGLNINEMAGYVQTMAHADQKISQFTGANDYLTGQSSEDLVGLQRLRIDSGINALYYIFEAIEAQYQKPFYAWAWHIKDIIEKGGKEKETLVGMIGSQKVSLIDRLDEMALHSMLIKISINPREEERQELRLLIDRLTQQGVLDASDVYVLSAIKNPRDKFKYTAVKEKKFRRRYDAEQQQRIAAQQEAIQAQGQNQVAAENAKVEGKNKNIYSQGQVDANLLQLASTLNLTDTQVQQIAKLQLQRERNTAQRDKGVEMLTTKANLENQNALST